MSNVNTMPFKLGGKTFQRILQRYLAELIWLILNYPLKSQWALYWEPSMKSAISLKLQRTID